MRLTILAILLISQSVLAADFQAVTGGNWHTTNTWGGVTIPGASDNVDLNGQAVTLTGTVTCASLVDVATGGSLDFGANASFTCRSVTDAPLTTSAAGVVVDCDYTLTTGNGFTINAGGEATIAGTWDKTSSGYGVYNNGGTVTDFSGTFNSSAYAGYGVYNYNGTWSDFSGTLNNTGVYGAYNESIWIDFSGTLNNSSSGWSYGAYNYGGTWSDFSGTLNTSSTEHPSGWNCGAYNDSVGTWSDFSGTLNNTGDQSDAAMNASGGTWTDFSGTLNNTGVYGAYNHSGSTWTDFSGTLNNNSTYTGAKNNGGTWSDFSGTLNHTGISYGAENLGGGTWTDFRGELNNESSGYGAWNENTWTDFSGTLNNSGSGYGVWNNGGTVTDFSGTLNNSGTGYGAYNNGGTWTDFSGECYDFGSGTAFYDSGYVNITGLIGRPSSQADLAAENIKSGKTILGTLGSLVATTYGDDDASKVLTTAANPGTFNEATRNTDPGEANVKSGTSYKIGNASKTGSYVSGYGINGTGLLGAGW